MTFSTWAGPCSGVLPLRGGAPPWSHVRACGVIAGAQVPSRSPGRSPRPVSFLSKRSTAVSSAPSSVTAQATGRALVPADTDHAKPGDRSTSDAKGGRKRGRRRGTVKPIRAEVPRRPELPFLVGAGSRGSGRHPRAPPSSSVPRPESRCRAPGQPCRLQTACPHQAGPRPGRFAAQGRRLHPSSEQRWFSAAWSLVGLSEPPGGTSYTSVRRARRSSAGRAGVLGAPCSLLSPWLPSRWPSL